MRLNPTARFLIAAAIVIPCMIVTYAQTKPCLTASNFGPNDEIGNVTYVTPEKTLAASKLITRGKAYRLGIETNKDTPAYGTRKWAMTVLQPGQAGGATMGPTKTTYNDDIITGWVGIGTQIDGLGHAGIDSLYFNCNKAADFAMPDGLKSWVSRRYRRLPRAGCCWTWPLTSTPTSSKKEPHSTGQRSKAH